MLVGVSGRYCYLVSLVSGRIGVLIRCKNSYTQTNRTQAYLQEILKIVALVQRVAKTPQPARLFIKTCCTVGHCGYNQRVNDCPDDKKDESPMALVVCGAITDGENRRAFFVCVLAASDSRANPARTRNRLNRSPYVSILHIVRGLAVSMVAKVLALRCKNTYNLLVNTEKIIKALGGTAEVARLCNVSPQAVSQWKTDGIPEARRMYLELLHPKAFATPKQKATA